VISKDISVTNFPDPLIMDGKVSLENLKSCQKSEQWLYQKLKEQHVKRVDDVHLALLLNNDELAVFKQ